MNNSVLPESLQRMIVGFIPQRNKITFQALTFGVISFAIFEYFSVINSNVPHIPVTWILILVFPVMMAVLFFKVVSILRNPRHEDLLFITGIDYARRKDLALSTFNNVQLVFRRFSILAAITVIVLEIAVFKITSIPDIVIPAAILLLTIYGFPLLFKYLLKSRLVQPIRKDRHNIARSAVSANAMFFSRIIINAGLFFRRFSFSSIRALVIRNVFILLRSEPLMIPAMVITAPVLCIVAFLIVHDLQSPFIDLFSAIAFFAVNAWLTSLLGESSYTLQINQNYAFSRKQILYACMYTTAFFALPVLLAYLIVQIPFLLSLKGILRLITGLLVMVIAAGATSSQVYDPSRRDSDLATGTIMFGGACIGLFIPYAGVVFPILIAVAFILKEWKCITDNRRLSIDDNM